jgi:hypothetical protein
MNEKYPLTTYPSSGLNTLGLHPIQAWAPILLLGIFTTLCILVKAGAILRLFFPCGSFLVGLFLYQKYPLMYVSYTFWIWFLTAFIRRLVDYQSGWQDPNTILLAPFLVTFISVATLLYKLPKAHLNQGVPFLLSFFGVLYGLFVGVIKISPSAVVVPFLNWATPVLFGFYLSTKWQEYPAYSKTIRRTFLWGVLITGAYGVFQYVIAPEWDRFWLINSGLTNSGGQPEPFKMRIFSTMHSAGPFSSVIMAGLLLLFSSQTPLKFPASAAGYLSFLLTLVRSAWFGWGVGILGLLTGLKPKLQMRLLVTLLITAICVVPIATVEPFSKVIHERFESFSNIKNDTSYNDRRENYDQNLNAALAETMGRGLGGSDKNIDSAVLDTLFSLGWLGTFLYISGLIYALILLFGQNEFSIDLFANSARAICLSMVAMLIFSSQMLGLSGAIFWGFLGIGIAANRYYKERASYYAKNNFR